MITDYKDTVTMIDNCNDVLFKTNKLINEEGLLDLDKDRLPSIDKLRYVDYTIASNLNFVLIELNQIVKLLQNVDENNLDDKPNAEFVEMTTAFNEAFNKRVKKGDSVTSIWNVLKQHTDTIEIVNQRFEKLEENAKSNTRDIRALSEEMASVQHDVIRLKNNLHDKIAQERLDREQGI